MKMIELEKATLDACVTDAQQERVVITRDGQPVAVVLGVLGMDEEQLQLSGSEKFWRKISERRNQKTLSRDELEAQLAAVSSN
jgi:PHD/YefM family antitoxin component YafN of YafNO toxin-antitoxin module